jgi:hypothetical protein
VIGLCLCATYVFRTSMAGSMRPQGPAAVGGLTGSAPSVGATASAVSTNLGLLKAYDSKNVLVGPVIGSAQYATVAYNSMAS